MPRITYAPPAAADRRNDGEPPPAHAMLTISDAHHAALCELLGGDGGTLDARHLSDLVRLSRGEHPTRRLVNLVRMIDTHGAVTVETVRR